MLEFLGAMAGWYIVWLLVWCVIAEIKENKIND